MEKKELIEYIKENLKVEISYWVPMIGNNEIHVCLKLGEEIISKSKTDLPDTAGGD